jgi:hypothetical protein
MSKAAKRLGKGMLFFTSCQIVSNGWLCWVRNIRIRQFFSSRLHAFCAAVPADWQARRLHHKLILDRQFNKPSHPTSFTSLRKGWVHKIKANSKTECNTIAEISPAPASQPAYHRAK